jgi:hypothetical protein
VLTIVFFLVGTVGLIARLWYGYDARMRTLEARGPWARQEHGPSVGTEAR